MFRDYGLDLEKMPPHECGTIIARRPQAVAIAAILNHWAWILPPARAPLKQNRAKSMKSLEPLTPTPSHHPADQVVQPDRSRLVSLAEEKNLADQPAPNIVLLAASLSSLGDFERARAVLQAGWKSHSDDPWINFELGVITDRYHLNRLEEATRYYTAAVATRPRSVLLPASVTVCASWEGTMRRSPSIGQP